MKLSDFAGMDAKMEQLMRSAQAGRIVHALLFTGPRGTGKRTMAGLFARAVLCQSGGERPCGVCPACKKCLEGMHPDVHVVAPEKNSIKVGQIRDLVGELTLAAYEGGKKIAIIERADSMNENAQNALLKTLENPVGDTMFILLTETPGTLLPTIISRCLQLRFHCLETDDCARVLMQRGIASDRATLLAALAQGSVGRALEIDGDEEYFPLRDRVIGALENMKKPGDVLQMTTAVGSDSKAQQSALEIMELWARDLMRVQNGMPPLQAADLHKLKKSSYSGSVLLRCIIELRRKLAANVPWVYALESMDFALTDGRT